MPNPEIRTLLIAALGGEGGGVLADWLVLCARQAGLAVQATSVPGVAQRTGATSYYLEFSTAPWTDPQPPVLALSPAPARVDVVVASELLEAARMMERGFVTPERTVLVASTSRVYTTFEKMQPHDGRYDAQRVQDLSSVLARRSIWMDMANIVQTHRTVLSAAMFGALAGSGVLPWSRAVCEQVIQASGKGVQASLAGFAEAYDQAQHGHSMPAPEQDADAPPPDAVRFTSGLPQAMRTLAGHGALRCLDYQDEQLARDYVDRLQALVALSPEPGPAHLTLWQETARHLALWVCYEDIIRVADLKTRPERYAQVRQEARAGSGDIVRITEHFKPGIEEIASILPGALGHWLLRRCAPRHWSLHIRSSSLWGYLMLRSLAALRPWRRRTLRHAQEQAVRDAWWQALCQLAPHHPEWGTVLARLPQVLKGYGETQTRGRLRYEKVWSAHVEPALRGQTIGSAETAAFLEALQSALSDLPERHPSPATSHRTVLWLQPQAPDRAPLSTAKETSP